MAFSSESGFKLSVRSLVLKNVWFAVLNRVATVGSISVSGKRFFFDLNRVFKLSVRSLLLEKKCMVCTFESGFKLAVRSLVLEKIWFADLNRVSNCRFDHCMLLYIERKFMVCTFGSGFKLSVRSLVLGKFSFQI